MADSESRTGSLLSLFWTPVVVVGCSDSKGRLNAQISVSTLGASIVPERPRLLEVLYKENLTHDLVLAKRSFCLSVLGREQASLLPKLGFVSGRDHDKLADLDVAVTGRGNPFLQESLGWLECEVIEFLDLGDATAFLAAVMDGEALRDGSPLVWSEARRTLPKAWLEQWQQKIAVDIERSLISMRWLAP